ncbi:MAG: ABC transporter ATP-binding protein [Pseudonocardia sp.]|nr:ABC transporter ATP-binding protein [Pseudonocardia sp.]
MTIEVLARAVGVRREFGDVVALDGVTLDVFGEQLVGMLGPNGAGKSTLISLMLGLRRPSAGRVELFGGDPREPGRRSQVGCTPQETGLPPTLSVREVVDFVGGHFPNPVPTHELLGRFALQELTRKQTGALSGGQQRRLAVALAFVGRPRLVVLDEPTTGLDVDARRALWDGIRDFHASGGTVLLTSHYLEEVEALAERVVVMAAGRVVADDTVRAVRSRVELRRVSLNLPAGYLLGSVEGASQVEIHGGTTHLLTPDADAVVRELIRADVPFADLAVRGASLEEAFVAMTRGAQEAVTTE